MHVIKVFQYSASEIWKDNRLCLHSVILVWQIIIVNTKKNTGECYVRMNKLQGFFIKAQKVLFFTSALAFAIFDHQVEINTICSLMAIS
jgi:hypothetical protein